MSEFNLAVGSDQNHVQRKHGFTTYKSAAFVGWVADLRYLICGRQWRHGRPVTLTGPSILLHRFFRRLFYGVSQNHLSGAPAPSAFVQKNHQPLMHSWQRCMGIMNLTCLDLCKALSPKGNHITCQRESVTHKLQGRHFNVVRAGKLCIEAPENDTWDKSCSCSVHSSECKHNRSRTLICTRCRRSYPSNC